MVNKVAIGGITVAVLAAAIIGIVVVSTHSSNHKPTSGQITSTAKPTIAALCAPTSYKEACENTLTGAINDTSSAGDIVRAAVKVITAHVEAASEKARELHKRAKGSIDNDGFEFCKELLEDAGERLADVIAEADNGNRLDDLQAWLSMVISYRTNCLASIESPELNAELTAALRNVTELTDNAIAIITAVADLAKELNLNWNLTAAAAALTGHRRLLNYPDWISAADRKLLGAGDDNETLPTPNAVVAKDGSGQFNTINDALNGMPETYRGRYVIYVKAGVYQEKVTVEKNRTNLLIYGDGPRQTVVTGRLNYAEGVGTFKTATFSVMAPGFIARSIGFRNTAGPEGHQAVALRLHGDAAVLYQVRVDGFQDSFYTQSGRHFVRDSVISGTVDFIFGDSQVVIQNSVIVLRHPMDNQKNTVTAHGRSTLHELTAIVIQNSRIAPDRFLLPDQFKIPSYLGRPWKNFSTTIVMESEMGDLIRPEGWLAWDGDFALDTLYYAEYNNRGAGSNTSGRVTWKGYRVIDRKEAEGWTAGQLLAGAYWIPFSGVPYVLELTQ